MLFNRWALRERELSLRFQSLAFVGDHISPPPKKNTEISPHRAQTRCAAIRIPRLAFDGVTFVPRGTADWPARVDCFRWMLAIGNAHLRKHVLAATPNVARNKQHYKDSNNKTPENGYLRKSL